jgi:hypothetical protein
MACNRPCTELDRRCSRPRDVGGASAAGRPNPAAVSRHEILMQVCYDLSSVTDRRGDTLGRTRADIADRENTRATRFERLPCELATSEHKSLAIERDVGVREPRTVRISANEEEQVMDRALHLGEIRRTPAYRFEDSVLAQ